MRCKNYAFKIIIIFFIFTQILLGKNCKSCHKNISYPDKYHKFKCEKCHVSKNKISKIKDHEYIIKNPSDLKYAKQKCGECHERDIQNVKNSIMSTNAGIINITRYLWRAQKSLTLKYTTYNLPDKTLVDDFLRKVCLRCHINTEGSKRYGEIRSSGCAACHVIYKNDGSHEHKFTKNIPTYQCLHCHNFNRVGMDYAGYFEHDYNQVYNSPIGNPKIKKIYGVLQHRLRPDIHYTLGLKCIDCHKKEDVMGDGKRFLFEYQQVKVRCVDCHKNPHKIEKYHKILECYACHSLWGAQNYGMHVVREDFGTYFRWKDFKDINIPDTQKILHKALGIYGDLSKISDNPNEIKFKKIMPYETDYLDNKKKLGVWYILWTYRRWEDPVLGIDHKGKVSPVRPDFQYYVTWIDKDMNVRLDSKKMIFGWDTYFPHTTAKYGRSCYSCHFNLKSLGLGYGMMYDNGTVINLYHLEKDGFKINFPLEKVIDIKGDVLQKFIYPDTSPLKIKIIKKMLKGGK